jgi:RNA polymerase sigma factor (sigma-70 family)
MEHNELHDRNPEAFLEIWNKDKPAFMARINRKFRFSEDDQEDIVAESFKDVWRTWPGFESLTHLRRYIYKTAYYKSLSFIQNQQKMAVKNAEWTYMQTHQQSTLEEQLQREYIMKVVLSHFDELPPRCREVLTLMVKEKLSDEEIANRLETTVSNVHTKKSLGIKLLKEKLGKDLPDDPNAIMLLILLIQFLETNS